VAQAAAPWVERVVVGNFDDDVLWGELEDEDFDVVLFGDVLEHLHDPLKTLREAVRHLVPSGMVVISVPNIAHVDIKIALLNGSFPYRDSGLLDRTHIHFFTKESVFALVEEAGLVVTEFVRVTVPAFATEIGVERDDVDDVVLAAMLKDPEAETYQFVVKAVLDNGATSLEHLADELVALSDRLHGETRQLNALREQFAVLQAQRAADQQELERLRHQMYTVKKFLPMPVIRLGRRLVGRR